MKRFLLFLLVITGGLAMASPGFRLLWQMETSSARIGLTHQDGVTQWADHGPKAFWPQWALAPEQAKLEVQVHYRPAPGHGEMGMARLTPRAPAPRVQAAYAWQLEQAGWTVEVSHFAAQLPEIPPRAARFCLVQALRDGKRLMFRSVEGDLGQDNLIWDFASELKPVIGAEHGLC